MKRDDIPFLNQLIQSMNEAVPKLEKAYKKKDANKLDEVKGVIFGIQKKISEILEE